MDGFLRVFRDIQGWFLKDFKEYPRMDFEGFSEISKDGFCRILSNIQRRFLKDFQEYLKMVS
jgi:hypothetical protein